MLKGVLANVLATTALKTTLISLLKKLVAAKIVATVVALGAAAATNSRCFSFIWLDCSTNYYHCYWLDNQKGSKQFAN